MKKKKKGHRISGCSGKAKAQTDFLPPPGRIYVFEANTFQRYERNAKAPDRLNE